MRKNLAMEVSLCLVLLLTVVSCQKEKSTPPGENGDAFASMLKQKIKADISFYALDGGTRIDRLSTNTRTALNSVAIAGLQASETILAIDFRPATGQLYGLSSASRIYVINPETGTARMIGAGAFSPALSGTVAGFDFNPTVDRIRVVTSSGQNLRLNPETGSVAVEDKPINGVAGAMVTGVAYTNNVAGAATTTLYDIDVTTQMLYKQMPPNDGTLVAVGALKLKVSGEGGFDIAPGEEVALGLYRVNNLPTLFSIDLGTGAATALDRYEKKMYTGIAIPTRAVAYAVDAINALLIFDPTNTASVISKPIGGLMAGENVAGIDFRPLNGQLYALTSDSRILTINASNGMSAEVGTLSTPLSGTDFAFDFNPVVDRIRIISNTGQNLRYNPNDPSLPVVVDGSLNPGTPAVTAAAYSNNFAGTTTTMLFDIDAASDKLFLQNPPNNGGLVEVGNLGINVSATSGFDIGGMSGMAWAILQVDGKAALYTINTTTGAATMSSAFSSPVKGFTVGLGF
jgi:hypothetical protein